MWTPMHRIQCSNDVPTSEPGTCRPTGPKMPGDRGLLPTDLLVLGKPSNGASEVKVLHGRNTIFGCGLLPIFRLGLPKAHPNLGQPSTFGSPVKALRSPDMSKCWPSAQWEVGPQTGIGCHSRGGGGPSAKGRTISGTPKAHRVHRPPRAGVETRSPRSIQPIRRPNHVGRHVGRC